MRRAAAVSGLLLVAALAGLSLPAGAAATGDRFAPQLFLRAARGYQIEVVNHGGAVALTVLRQHGRHGGVATTYVARGTATARHLQASFGSLGRISMRFQPAAARARLAPHGHCQGPGTLLVKRGVFVGELRFRGEGGYVSVHVHRARGQIAHLARRCQRHPRIHRRRLRFGRDLLRPSPIPALSPEVPFLAARWKGATASELFLAMKLHRKTAFIALTSNDAGRLSLFHVAVALASGRRFALDGALTAGHATPPAPFSGTGTYAAAADGTKTWDGPLAVNFPGAPGFGLTGAPLEPTVGTLPAVFALFLLKTAKAGDAVSLAAAEKPSLLSASTAGS